MNKLYVNEIFESVQGEGYNTGRLATFVRFAGCNLRCAFCDTKYSWDKERYVYKEAPVDLFKIIVESEFKSSFIILTGGEPLTQDFDALCEFVNILQEHGYEVALETNGSIDFAHYKLKPDWITVSPKQIPFAMERGDELKLLYTGDEDLEWYGNMRFKQFYLQPVLPDYPIDELPIEEDGRDYGLSIAKETALWWHKCRMSTAMVVRAIKKNPKWKLSFQAHKLAGLK